MYLECQFAKLLLIKGAEKSFLNEREKISSYMYPVCVDVCAQTFLGNTVLKILSMEVENEQKIALSGLMAGCTSGILRY